MNAWQIRDKNGVIHSGTEDEMRLAFDIMTIGIDEMINRGQGRDDITRLHHDYYTSWKGDLELVQVIAIYK